MTPEDKAQQQPEKRKEKETMKKGKKHTERERGKKIRIPYGVLLVHSRDFECLCVFVCMCEYHALNKGRIKK